MEYLATLLIFALIVYLIINALMLEEEKKCKAMYKKRVMELEDELEKEKQKYNSAIAYAKLVRRYGKVPDSMIVKSQLEAIHRKVFFEELENEIREKKGTYRQVYLNKKFDL